MGMHITPSIASASGSCSRASGPPWRRSPRGTPRAADHRRRVEAHLIASAPAPPRRPRLLDDGVVADELVRREVVTAISGETVPPALKKNALSPGRSSPVRPGAGPRPVRRRHGAGARRLRRGVLRGLAADLHGRGGQADDPRASRSDRGVSGRRPRRTTTRAARGAGDLHVLRPVRGWRRVSGRTAGRGSTGPRRCAGCWTRTTRMPPGDAGCDNLNTHGRASLYEAFPARGGVPAASRLRIVHTPPQRQLLNVAEIELSVLARQWPGPGGSARRPRSTPSAPPGSASGTRGEPGQWRFTTPMPASAEAPLPQL